MTHYLPSLDSHALTQTPTRVAEFCGTGRAAPSRLSGSCAAAVITLCLGLVGHRPQPTTCGDFFRLANVLRAHSRVATSPHSAFVPATDSLPWPAGSRRCSLRRRLARWPPQESRLDMCECPAVIRLCWQMVCGGVWTDSADASLEWRARCTTPMLGRHRSRTPSKATERYYTRIFTLVDIWSSFGQMSCEYEHRPSSV